MMSISLETPDEMLSGMLKPSLKSVDQVSLSAEDCLVVCAGFEERAVAVLQNAIVHGSQFRVVLILYEPYVAENRADEIRQTCRARDISILELVYDREHPAGFGALLVESVSTCRGCVVIDISGMSRLLIVQALVALSNRVRGLSGCLVAYAEAQDYPPTEEEAAKSLAKSDSDPAFSVFFLSSGVFDVTLVPELSSYAPAGVQTRLVAFPSLDAHQLTALRAELQPSRLSFIEGVPPSVHNEWRSKAISKVNQLDQIRNADRKQLSTLFYEQTLCHLLRLYAEHGLHERLLVSPTGSKMQAVAVGLLRCFLEDVQIVYPTPRDFLRPENYTRGVGQLYLLALDSFSRFSG